MECITCENTDTFNRVIVNQVSGEEVGGYCHTCEEELFGELLDSPAWHQEYGCSFCDGSGTYRIPKLECLIENENDHPQHIEYTIIEDTVSICDTHLEALLSRESGLKELLTANEKRKSPVEA